MKTGLHNLAKSKMRKKRIGRGIANKGAKSGRGMKGQRSRAGATIRAGFEGGQTPLYQRLPKARGAKQTFASQKVHPRSISVGSLNQYVGEKVIGTGMFRKSGVLKRGQFRTKLVGGGEINTKITVRVHSATAAAVSAVEKAGGKVEIIEVK